MPPTKRGRGASAPARPQDIIPLGRGNAPQPQSVQRRATPSTPALTPLGNKQIPPILPEGEDVVNTILELDAKQEIDKKAQLIENILDWLCQKIIVNMNTERYYYTSMVSLAKTNPQVFDYPTILTKLEQMLYISPAATGFNAKKCGTLSMLAALILHRVYRNVPDWPVEFAKAFITDSIQERTWVDHETAKDFVSEVLTAFYDDDVRHEDENQEDTEMRRSEGRYAEASVKEQIIQIMQNTIGNALSTNNMETIKNVIKLLQVCCPTMAAARQIAIKSMENWLNAPNIMKFARDLLIIKICPYISDRTEMDIDTFGMLLAMKIKQAQTQTHIEAISLIVKNEMNQHIITPMALRCFLQNELMQQKPLNNFKTFQQVLKALPSVAYRENRLGMVLQEMAAVEKEVWMLKSLTKRLVRSTPDFDIVEFCRALLHPREQMLDQPEEARNFWTGNLVELVCVVMIAYSQVLNTSGEPNKERDEEFRFMVARIQAEGVEWCNNVLPKYLPNLDGTAFNAILTHILMLKPINIYLPIPNDMNAPAQITEQEQKSFAHYFNELPIENRTLVNIIYSSLMNRYISNSDAITVIHTLICKAAKMRLWSSRPCFVQMEEDAILSAMFQLSLFDPAQEVKQQDIKIPPLNLCYRGLFWKVCTTCVILAAANPSTMGLSATRYPVLKYLLEKVLKNQWGYIPEDEMSQQHEIETVDVTCREMVEFTRQNGLELEIFKNDQNPGFWSSIFMTRKFEEIHYPPQDVLVALQATSATLMLGNTLRACRSPDFLLEIMNREGPHMALVWLTGIIREEINTLSVLPVAVLCELLLVCIKNPKDKILVENIIARLSEAIFNVSDLSLSLSVLSFYLDRISSDHFALRNVAQDALGRLLTKAIYDPLEEEAMEEYGVTQPKYKWLQQIPRLICYSASKEILWQSYIKLCTVETNLPLIAALTEFMYATYVRNALDISTVLSTVLIERTYMGDRLFKDYINTLTQKIFTEAFNYLKNIQQMLIAQNRMHQNMIELLISSDRKLILPELFIHGLMMLISLPNVPKFTNELQEVVNNIFNSPSATNLFALPKVMPRLLLTNNQQIVTSVLGLMSLEDLLITSLSFGLSSATKESVFEKISSFSFIDKTVAVSALTESQRQGLDSRFAELVRGIEEQHEPTQQEKPDSEMSESEERFNGDILKLLQSAYKNDQSSISILRSLLLAKTHQNEIGQVFKTLTSLHHTNTHLTLMILSCLDNVEIQGGNDMFKYITSVKSSSTSDIEEFFLNKQQQVRESPHLIQEKLSQELPSFETYFSTPHRGVIADLITNHDPSVLTQTLRKNDDPYLLTLMMQHRDSHQLKQSIPEMLTMNGLGFVGTVLNTVEGMQIDEKFVQQLGKIIQEQKLESIMKEKPEFLVLLLDSILPKSILDIDLEQKKKNRIALIEALGESSSLVQYLYSLSPQDFPTPEKILYAPKIEVFLHALILKMTDANRDISDFAQSLMCKYARQYPLIVCRYIKTATAILTPGNSDIDTAMEVISDRSMRRYAQVLEILDATRPELFNHLDILSTLIDKFFLYIKTELMHVPMNPMEDSDEQLQIKEYIQQFLIFLQKFESQQAITYLSKHRNLIQTIETYFGVSIPEKPPLERITQVQANMSTRMLESLEQSEHDILPYVVHQLCDQLLTENALIAYRLLLRTLRHYPLLAKEIIPKYLECLMHFDDTVRLRAISHAYDIFPYCSTHQDQDLLWRLFQSGKQEGLNMLTRILNMLINL